MNKALLWIGVAAIGFSVLSLPSNVSADEGTQEAASSSPVNVVDEQGSSLPVEVAGDRIEYLRDEKKIIADGNVIVTYKDMTLTCDHVEVLSDLKQAKAKGHVVLYRGTKSFRGDEVYYDFEKQQGAFPDGRAVDVPWHSHGERVEQVGPERIEIYNGQITSCDLDRPHYELAAKRITIYLGDKAVCRNVVFKVLGKPVFWWPYYIIPLDNRQPPIEISPGHSKRWGYYVLTSKGFSINKHISGKWHADWRSKRGFGAGVDLRYEFPKTIWGEGEMKLYGTNDRDAPDPRAASPYAPDSLMDEERGRFSYRHRSQLTPRTTLFMNWSELSDEYFLSDFFQREHREDISPETFINVTHNSKRYGLFVEMRKRTNRFDSTLERLPEVRFNWKTAELADTGIYYQNEETFAVLNKKNSRSAEDTDVVRSHTFHQLNYPRKFFRVDINPNVNWEGTYWSKQNSGEENITRQVWGGGVETSTKFYRIYDVAGSVAGIRADKIRHLIEPSVVYTAKRKVTREDRSIFQLDALDSRAVTDRLIYGIENRIQTKRIIKGVAHRVDIVSMGSFLTYNMDRGRTYGSKWDTLTNNIQFRPYDWLGLEWNGNWNMERDRWSSSNEDIVITYENFSLVVGHRYLIESSSLMTLDTNYWLNERWAVGMYWRHEFDRNRAEEYEIRLTRDLHDWLLDFGFNSRHNTEFDRFDTELFFELTLKAYPDRTFKSGNRSSIARPRIGKTVSGAETTVDIDRFRRQGYRDESDPLLNSSPTP